MAEVSYADIERAIRDRDPQLGALLVRYMAEDDPAPGAPEIPADEDGADDPPEVPEGAWTRDRLQAELAPHAMRGKTATERKLARREAFAAAEASPFAPPRLRLGKLLVALYESGEVEAREALAHAFREGRLGWGAWQGAKAIYKLAEARHDAAMFGVLAYRLDALKAGDQRFEVGQGTVIYMRRRAWRYLRQLGRAVPDVYPTFVVEVLRHYPADHKGLSWVAGHVFSHNTMGRGPAWFQAPPERSLGNRAFPDAWKLSPSPLLRLLDLASNEQVCAFAIRSLRHDHPLALRAVEPAWLARLGARPIGALHGFVVALLKDNPDLHPSRLREVGLHDVVLGFLKSPDNDARAYALDYANAHAPDLTVEFLVDLFATRQRAVEQFAAARLEPMLPTLPLPVLTKLLAVDLMRKAAGERIKAAHQPADLTSELFVELVYAGDAAEKWVTHWFAETKVAIPAGHWRAVADDARRTWRTLRSAMQELGKRTAAEIGVAWIQKALFVADQGQYVQPWLQAGMLAGADLDVEWVKGLVARSRYRALALRLLGDRKIVAPARIGIAWLLDLARSSDPELQQFAQSQLLQNFAPDDFAGDGHSGIDRLWDLAAGRSRKEPVRQFAALYLRAHHPDIGPHAADTRTLGIKPRLARADYPLARVRPLLDDERADVRRLAVAIAREEIARWGDKELLYALASSRHREPQRLGCELLLAASAQATDALPAEWIDGARLFVLAESPHKTTRETALTVIRKRYDDVGAPERLAWLMESPERDVRLFAVRLFWDRHRPRPQGDPAAFADVAALRQFLRTVLYGLPPGRVERRAAVEPGAKNAPLPERALPASVGKRRLVEAIRDLAVREAAFAGVVVPVLSEFTASEAKGEWQACTAALAAMRRAHGAALEVRS